MAAAVNLGEDPKRYSWAGGAGTFHPYSLLLSFSRYVLRLMRHFSPKSEKISGDVVDQEEEAEKEEKIYIEESKYVEPKEAGNQRSRSVQLLSLGPARKPPKGGVGQHY